MNNRIFELIKTTKPLVTKILSPFSLSHWAKSLSGNGGSYGGTTDTYLWSRFHYLGNGSYFRSIPSASCTIDKLRKAKEIKLTYRWGTVNVTNVWVFNSYSGYVNLLNGYISCNLSTLKVGGVAVCSLAQNVDHNIVFKQKKCIVNGVEYLYSNGVQLKNATGDNVNVYAAMNQCTAGGYACIGDMRIYLTNFSAKI